MKKWIWHSDVWSFLCYNLTFTERKLGQIFCQIFIYSLIFYISLFFLSSPLSVFLSPHFSIYYMCIYDILFFFTISLSPTFVHILILSHLPHVPFFLYSLSLSFISHLFLIFRSHNFSYSSFSHYLHLYLSLSSFSYSWFCLIKRFNIHK